MNSTLKKNTIVFINLVSGFGGGEFQTEQLIRSLTGYQIYFFGRKNGLFSQYLKKHYPHIEILSFMQLIILIWSKKKGIIIQAQDGRGAHLARILKSVFGVSVIITRHVNTPLKHRSSIRSYQIADILVGVSQQITKNLCALNPNSTTIYGCIKSLAENTEFEQLHFADKSGLNVMHIGNLQYIKNFSLTIELAKRNPDVNFYLVGSGKLEMDLRQQAQGINNVHFIPFTPYIGSVFKFADLQIIPSLSEGLGGVILEGYQYQVPVLAHAVGGIPEIVEDGITGYLITDNTVEAYQQYLDQFKQNSALFTTLKTGIQSYMEKHNFSAERMAKAYINLYQSL